MTIINPDNFSLEQLDETFLWRYVSLHKLLDLVLNKQIYFSRLDDFEDGVEGLTGYGIQLKFFTMSEPLTAENVNPAFDKDEQILLVAQDQNTRQEYLHELTSSQQTQFASCWFLGDRESLSMWKIYSQKDGVALKFNARELVDTVLKAAESYTNSPFEYLTYGPLEYKNIWPFDHSEKFDGKFNAMKKDKSYFHENEFRFITVVDISKKGLYKNFILPIGDLSSYDLKIIANPFMDRWEIDNLKKLLTPYKLDSKVFRSQMDIKR